MGQILGLMSEYFVPSGAKMNESLPKEIPIKAKKTEWQITQDSSFLIRKYEFKNDDQLKWFVNEILNMQKLHSHYPYIMIDKRSVILKVGTRTLGAITELDTEFAARSDSIFKDSEYLKDETSK